jgi:hypothetical protein
MTIFFAKHLREVYHGGNWTASNLAAQLTDIDWQQATTSVYDLNTIATLVFHINYYVEILIVALTENKLEGSDKLSFNCPPINAPEDWEALKSRAFGAAEKLQQLVIDFEKNDLEKVFFQEKYGNYQRNFMGLIEHTHYHLGQIALIKKIILGKKVD